MSLPRLLKRPSSAIFASSRAHHPHDTLFLTSLPATGATRHVRWASIVPYTIHNPNPPPPPLTPEQVLAQLQQQEPQYGVPLDPFQPFGQQQSPQQPHPLTQEQLEQRLEHQQRLRQQEELQLQLQRHRNALQQQQLKRQIEQELELELEQGQEQDHIKGGNAEMRGKIAASTTSEEAAARCHPKEETREDNNHHKNGQDLQQTSSEHRPTDHHHHSAPAATTTTEEEQQQRLLELRKQRRSTFGYYFQLHPTRQQQHGLQQPQQAQPVRDLVQEAVTRTLSISTILPKRVSKISFEDRVQLAMLDYTGTQIDAMAPERAAEILLQAKASPKTQQDHHTLK
ncbi:hypothetical protein DFQ27_002026 [Actinomortierella ambigua]|uniref:Uncharacterized protein n=1 Tax=Actinomortierella ambigua TaxID=1343610 RepID=A0A9P6U6R9_9FUNG|nr:hypothetical protein DFQ27_002026 [Actinomortierella ambigua]